jgi:hypothetical protein
LRAPLDGIGSRGDGVTQSPSRPNA